MDALVPSTVIAAYAEALLEGRRVIVFGDATSGLAEHLVDRGARIVHVYDRDPARAAESSAKNRSRNISVSPFAEDDVAVRDGAFDLAIVDDISDADDPGGLVKRVRRALSPRGTTIVASANPDARFRLLGPHRSRAAIGYYDLYDLVAAEYEYVRMLGQAPFAGYAIVDFAHEGELDLSIDTGFVPNGAEEPEWFIAMGSDREVELDAFAVIQLPLSSVLPMRTAAPEADRALREQHQAALDHISRMQADQAASREELDARRLDHERFEAELALLRKQIAEKENWIAQLEARAAAADARADETLGEVERARVKESEGLAALEAQVSELERSNAHLIGELKNREEQLERFLTTDDVSAADEYGRLEAELKGRGAEVRRLEKELREAVRAGRELAEELSRRESPLPQVSPELLEDMATLTATNARLAADLAAARWSIQELEDRLQAFGPSQGEPQAQAHD